MEVGDLSLSGDPEGTEKREDDKNDLVLQFMDSLDAYLTLLDFLSVTLRQGWFKLASARHSMDPHASQVLCLTRKNGLLRPLCKSENLLRDLNQSRDSRPLFALYKWASLRNGKFSSEELEVSCAQKMNKNSQLRHRGSAGSSDDTQLLNSTINLSPTTSDGNMSSLVS